MKYLVIRFDSNEEENEPELLYSGNVYGTARAKARFYAKQEFREFEHEVPEIKDHVHLEDLGEDGYEVYEDDYWFTQFRIVKVDL